MADNVLTVEKTFGEEHIVAMHDTPLLLVRAPGPNMLVVPLFLTVVGHISGHTPFTGGGTIFLQIANNVAACNIDPSVLTNPDDSFSTTVEFALSTVELATARNAAIGITNDTQAFADGTDSSMDVFLVYQLVKLTS